VQNSAAARAREFLEAGLAADAQAELIVRGIFLLNENPAVD
jgi:hypothetical protein